MSELDEFAEALFGQLDVELNEEREIRDLAGRITGDPEFGVRFPDVETVCGEAFPEMAREAADFLGIKVPDHIHIEYPELDRLKAVKGRKVFAGPDSRGFVDDLFGAVAAEDRGAVVDMIRRDPARYLVYSTYAIQYISKITTTYGDYMDGTIFVNKFVLSRYPGIVLYRMGKPYRDGRAQVESGYRGAVKMTVLEETVHSMQEPLQRANQKAAMAVNEINEELARIVLDMDADSVRDLSEYLQLQAVPDDFPFARRANLFFFLNPDHFLTGQVGPDIMTYTRVEVDPKISGYVPDLPRIYQKWLRPIQLHHAAFSVMEGMAGYAVQNILGGDPDFESYLGTFIGTDSTSYHIRKGMGADFVRDVCRAAGRESLETMVRIPPTTKELKDPQTYVRRVAGL